MAEYIEREAILKKNMYGNTKPITHRTYAEELIKSMPNADVVEVKHGEWLLKSNIYKMLDDVDEEFYVECPFCHKTEYVPFELEEEKMLKYAKAEYPYCHCGAKMDGETNQKRLCRTRRRREDYKTPYINTLYAPFFGLFSRRVRLAYRPCIV